MPYFVKFWRNGKRKARKVVLSYKFLKTEGGTQEMRKMMLFYKILNKTGGGGGRQGKLCYVKF